MLAWLDHEAGPASDPGSAERAAALVRGRLRASDIDPGAVAATRRAIGLRCAPYLDAHDPALDSVRVGDGLSEPLPASVILCNPPWISYSGRQRGHAAPDAVSRDGGWPALHASAVSALVARLAPEGVAGFVLPGQVAALAGYAGLRRVLAARVRRVELLGEGAFPGVVSPACLVALGPASDEPLVTVASGRRVELPRALLLAEPERPWLPRLEDRSAACPGPPTWRRRSPARSSTSRHACSRKPPSLDPR